MDNNDKAEQVVSHLLSNPDFDFCDDGIIPVYPDDVKTFGVELKMLNGEKKQSSKQYISRNGLLIIRKLENQDDKIVFVCIENRILIGNDPGKLTQSRDLLKTRRDLLKTRDLLSRVKEYAQSV